MTPEDKNNAVELCALAEQAIQNGFKVTKISSGKKSDMKFKKTNTPASKDSKIKVTVPKNDTDRIAYERKRNKKRKNKNKRNKNFRTNTPIWAVAKAFKNLY